MTFGIHRKLISMGACALALTAGAAWSAQTQTGPQSPQTELQVPTFLGTETFLVADPFASQSAASRVNRDLADKLGRIPAPTAGYVLHAAVVVETDDAFTLESLVLENGGLDVQAIEAAPGFWLARTANLRDAIDLTAILRAAFGAEQAYLDVNCPKALRMIPSDPLFGQQWHLRNTSIGIADVNAEAAWNAGYTGAGVILGVLEGGAETSHPDLNDNYSSAASQSGGSSSHGTSVAGVMSAEEGNGQGGVGVAYGSQWSKQYYGSSSSTANAFNYRNDLNDIKNNSWGPADNGTISYLSSVERAALENSTATGRGGLGEIFAWAAGNGGSNNDRVEYDPYASSRLTLAIGAIGDQDVSSWYNEDGSSMLVVAHSSGNNRGITTTTTGGGYTSGFGGTSSASPLGAGVVALMFDANPNLTWRDVQHVLIHSARKNNAASSGWSTNAAGHDIHYQYGFGAVEAGDATSVASTWSNVAPVQTVTSGRITENVSIPDNNPTGVTRSLTINQDIKIEHVELILNVSTTYVGDLEIILTAPSGTQSILAEARADSQDNYVNYILTSNRHWDESSAGTWTLKIADLGPQDLATWQNWEVKVYGTPLSGGGLDLAVSPTPLVAGSLGTFDVTNGAPNSLTGLFYSVRGTGSTFWAPFNVVLGLDNAKSGANPINSNGAGAASWTQTIPNKASGRNVWLQAAQQGATSNVVATSVN